MFEFEKPNIEISEISEDNRWAFCSRAVSARLWNDTRKLLKEDHALISAGRCSQCRKDQGCAA